MLGPQFLSTFAKGITLQNFRTTKRGLLKLTAQPKVELEGE